MTTYRSNLPPPPKMQELHRYDLRFWNTRDMMEVLAVYYGATAKQYPYTWWYRTLIRVHRAEQELTNYTRKGYGKDWKDTIKRLLIEFLQEGTLPPQAKKHGAELIRSVEVRMWGETHVAREHEVPVPRALRVAAE